MIHVCGKHRSSVESASSAHASLDAPLRGSRLRKRRKEGWRLKVASKVIHIDTDLLQSYMYFRWSIRLVISLFVCACVQQHGTTRHLLDNLPRRVVFLGLVVMLAVVFKCHMCMNQSISLSVCLCLYMFLRVRIMLCVYTYSILHDARVWKHTRAHTYMYMHIMHVRVCVCVGVCACLGLSLCLCLCLCLCVRVCVCLCVCLSLCICACVCVCVYVRARVHVSVHACVCAYVWACACICARVSVCVCVYIHIYVCMCINKCRDKTAAPPVL